MTARTVLIPPGSVGTLDACRTIFKDIAEVTGAAPVDVEALMASTILQAGVERFLVYSKLGRDVGQSSFVRGRVDTLEPPGLDALYRTMSATVRSQFTKEPPEGRVRADALAGEIVDLVIASRYRTSLMLSMPFIDIVEYKPFLRPAFFAALEVFLGTIEVEATSIPLPRRVATTNAIKRFHTLLDSDLFGTYSEAHRQLQSPRSDLQQQARRVAATARSLTFGFSDSLTLQSLALSGVAVTSYVIDTFLGKLPAAALAPFKTLFESHFTTDHRVIIYDFHSVWWRSFHEQVAPIVEAMKHERGRTINENPKKKA